MKPAILAKFTIPGSRIMFLEAAVVAQQPRAWPDEFELVERRAASVELCDFRFAEEARHAVVRLHEDGLLCEALCPSVSSCIQASFRMQRAIVSGLWPCRRVLTIAARGVAVSAHPQRGPSKSRMP